MVWIFYEYIFCQIEYSSCSPTSFILYTFILSSSLSVQISQIMKHPE